MPSPLALPMKRLLAVALALALGGCFAWQKDVERGGYVFSTYRQDPKAGVHIGVLARDARAGPFVCRGGGWAHFNADWSLSACFLAQPHAREHFTFPAGTWMRPRADRLVAAFARDEACQGFVCTGTGGPKGYQASFYPNGRLMSFYPRRDTAVSGVLCAASPFADIKMHENGQLSECRAAAAGVRNGTAYSAGQIVRLDAAGRG